MSIDKINILISLHKGYGLGDAVQMSTVLRHAVAARSHWVTDFQAEDGKQWVGSGIVDKVFAYGEPYPRDHYDAEVQIRLYDTWANWGDRPNTRVCSCLHEQFGLGWKPEYGRYHISVSQKALDLVRWRLKAFGSRDFIAIHYEGDSSQAKKNLNTDQAARICVEIDKLGYSPLILDWRRRSTLECCKLQSPEKWGGNAETVCAVISQCKAFVGIDSGPSKCASATNTPAAVIWTGHHPAPFHDPAPNTTHIVPIGYHGLDPVCNDVGVINWFEENYNVLKYVGDPVSIVTQWLRRML